MRDISIKWNESNDEILNETMKDLDRIRRILREYTRFTIVGTPGTGRQQEELAQALVVNMSKPVAWLTGRMQEALVARDGDDALEYYVGDQSNADTLVVVFSTNTNYRPIEKVLHYCAEHLYPCLVLSGAEQPTFDFPSKVYELKLKGTNAQFEFAMSFLIQQATIPDNELAYMRIEK